MKKSDINTILKFQLKNLNNDQNNDISIQMNQQQIEQLYHQLETIQQQLDSMA